MSSTTLRWLVRALLVLAVVAARPSPAHDTRPARPRQGATHSAPAHEVVAALLINFARFVEWPADASSPDAPIRIVVVGDGEVRRALRVAAPGLTIRGRAIEVLSERHPDDVERAHLAYFPADESQPDEARLGLLSTRGVLTVGESALFLERGGAIRLVVESERMRFHVREGADKDAGIKISSALMDLATVVRVASASKEER